MNEAYLKLTSGRIGSHGMNIQVTVMLGSCQMAEALPQHSGHFDGYSELD
jgi:hypothetical protein